MNVDRDGDVIKRADFYNIKLFGRDAELALTNLEMGDRIHFKGRVFPTEYVNRDDELVESVEINADMGEVYPAPLWESFDINNDEDDEDDRPARRSRKSSKRKASKRRRKEEEEAQDWDDDEDLDDEEDLDDDFEEDAAPKRPTRSRSRSRSRKKSSDVDVDDDADEYEDLI